MLNFNDIPRFILPTCLAGAPFLEADRRVVQETEFQSDDPALAGTMRLIWALDPMPDGTRVSVTCENVPEGISKEDHDAGLRSTLANLASFTE